MKSIVQSEKRCYICGTCQNLERHHIFMGPDRKLSEKYGLTVYLCHMHHNEPPDGAHFNENTKRWLQRVGQMAFEQEYGHEKFMELFTRNYL